MLFMFFLSFFFFFFLVLFCFVLFLFVFGESLLVGLDNDTGKRTARLSLEREPHWREACYISETRVSLSVVGTNRKPCVCTA